MRKTFLFTLLIVIVTLASCSKPQGQLIGVYSKSVKELTPYGMVEIPGGNFLMGPNDQSITFAIQSDPASVSVDAFWMDITEITNGEYRQFVYWVRDSIVRTNLMKVSDTEFKKYAKLVGDPFRENTESDTILNWNTKIDWNKKLRVNAEGMAEDDENTEIYKAINDVFYQGADKLGGKQLNAQKMNYYYRWIANDQAILARNCFDPSTGSYRDNASVTVDTAYWEYNEEGRAVKFVNKVIKKPLRSRADLVSCKILNIYPDTLCWMTEFSYSFNEPQMQNYFSHPSYAYHPVVGITWEQATAFCHWRTDYYSNHSKQPRAHEYRLPTEAEWEYAARGGRSSALYPWGGPYIRDAKGCYMANFKPMRGNYTVDGYLIPAHVGSYAPNDYGLYDMAGNVSEWTSQNYDESLSEFTLDFNPTYSYNARNNDPKQLKRKVIKGGSWKDIGAYLQCGMRDYEYQDQCRPYIGFRCVRSKIAE